MLHEHFQNVNYADLTTYLLQNNMMSTKASRTIHASVQETSFYDAFLFSFS